VPSGRELVAIVNLLVWTGGFESELVTTDPQAVNIIRTVTVRQQEIARIILFSRDKQANTRWLMAENADRREYTENILCDRRPGEDSRRAR